MASRKQQMAGCRIGKRDGSVFGVGDLWQQTHARYPRIQRSDVDPAVLLLGALARVNEMASVRQEGRIHVLRVDV
jgi:hypothetical protein